MSSSAIYQTEEAALKKFMVTHRIVVESAKTSGHPSMVSHIVGKPYQGSWWSLPDSSEIYNALLALREWPDVHVCRLVRGKITYVHCMCWPALVALVPLLPVGVADRLVEEHLPSGRHKCSSVPVETWSDERVRRLAKEFTPASAFDKLQQLAKRALDPRDFGTTRALVAIPLAGLECSNTGKVVDHGDPQA